MSSWSPVWDDDAVGINPSVALSDLYRVARERLAAACWGGTPNGITNNPSSVPTITAPFSGGNPRPRLLEISAAIEWLMNPTFSFYTTWTPRWVDHSASPVSTPSLVFGNGDSGQSRPTAYPILTWPRMLTAIGQGGVLAADISSGGTTSVRVSDLGFVPSNTGRIYLPRFYPYGSDLIEDQYSRYFLYSSWTENAPGDYTFAGSSQALYDLSAGAVVGLYNLLGTGAASVGFPPRTRFMLQYKRMFDRMRWLETSQHNAGLQYSRKSVGAETSWAAIVSAYNAASWGAWAGLGNPGYGMRAAFSTPNYTLQRDRARFQSRSRLASSDLPDMVGTVDVWALSTKISGSSYINNDFPSWAEGHWHRVAEDVPTDGTNEVAARVDGGNDANSAANPATSGNNSWWTSAPARLGSASLIFKYDGPGGFEVGDWLE